MTLHLEEFKEWVAANGSVVLPLTNEWEVLRYKTPKNAVGIIYKNKRGQHSFSPVAGQDYPTFLKAAGLAKTERVDRLAYDKKAKLKQLLLERDGPVCCYCDQFMEKPTIEHFHSISSHGNNHPDNCALACNACNLAADNLPVIEKIKLRDRIRETVAQVPPWEAFDARSLA